MDFKAYGKINLSLDVTGILPNGYHSVSMVMQSVELCDIVSIEKREDKNISITTDNPAIPNGCDNLAYRAADLMVKEFDILHGFDIKIAKNIPLSGGMAGGSTDAAAVICGINEMCDLKKRKEELMKLGVTLGADIPFCIQKKPALAEGIGEKLSSITGLSKDLYILLVNPNVEISTKEIYSRIDAKKCYNTVDNNALVAALKRRDLPTAVKNMKNVMQSVTSELCPQIDEIIEKLYSAKAKVALMSGSGATCYGVFTDIESAKNTQKLFGEHYFTKITNTIE